MTVAPIPDVPPFIQEANAPRRMSKAALTSLLLSLVFCCPLTTLAALVTGSIAILLTLRDRTLLGMWMAILAIVFGLAGTGFQVWFYPIVWLGYQQVWLPIRSGPQLALLEGDSGNISGFQSQFAVSSVDGNTTESAQAFIDAVKERYGAFESASLDSASAPAATPSASQGFAGDYELNFARGRMRANCKIEIVTQQGALSMRLLQLTIFDADLGDLSFPPVTPGSSDSQTEPDPSSPTNGD